MSVDLSKYVQELESISCNACGQDNYEVLSNRERYDLSLQAVMCRGCSFIYINPRPLKRAYEKLNMADYRLAAVGHDGPDDHMFKRQRDHALKVTIPFIQRHTDAHVIESVLDIGCLYGGTMAGWLKFNDKVSVEGIEPVVNVAEYARKNVDGKVTTGIMENFEDDKGFDLAIFAQALNHTLDPKGNLEKIRNLLNDDGFLFISLYDAVSAVLNRPLEKMVEVTHPYMFSRETIQYLLLRSGFSIVGYEDNLLDAQDLDKNCIPRLSFPRIRVLAQKSLGDVRNIEKPDYQVVRGRLKRNINFYEKWNSEILKWYKPNPWRRVVKEVMHANRKYGGYAVVK